MAAMRREEAVAELTRPGAPFEIVETEVGGVPGEGAWPATYLERDDQTR